MKRTINILVFLFLAGISVGAQGTITGRITDPFGAVWPNAKITLSRESVKNDPVRETTTDNAGEYTFANVPFGSYLLRVKVVWVNREFSRHLELSSTTPLRSDAIFSLAPCADEEDLTAPKITSEDHAEIVRNLVGILIGNSTVRRESGKIILLRQNLSPEWLSSEHLARVSILTGDKIHELSEKSGSQIYYSFLKPVQRGRCVGITIINSFTVQGQMENANMAGGEDNYEFRKVNGKWTGLLLYSMIS